MTTLLVRGERVMLPGGERPAAIHVQDGRIVGIGDHGDRVAGVPVLDAGPLVILPGLVDTHVHINDPGRADWEGFTHATQSAAAGGITTLVDMPLNSIPSTTTVAGLAAKRRAADGQCFVDVGFWGGVVPGNAADLEPLAQAGVLGYKCFLSPSGVDEFAHVTEADLRRAMPILARLELPLLVHAEMPALLREPAAGGDPRRYLTWLDSRPAASEQAAIELMIRLAREFGTRVHIVHLASADALPALAAARDGGVQVTVETCPHYLTFCAEEIADGATALKCAPPIRGRAHRERLWKALESGLIDLVATDHSPAPLALKHIDDGNFLEAWGGVASLQISLAVVASGARARNIPAPHLSQWLAAAPARLAGLSGVKGAIAVGLDADFAFWDPDQVTVVDARALYHRHPVTPYDGARLRGHVVMTILRGQVIFDDGKRINGVHGRAL
ncbi:MAG: allantoinase AllB [Vicinamibacterales bacterium]